MKRESKINTRRPTWLPFAAEFGRDPGASTLGLRRAAIEAGRPAGSPPPPPPSEASTSRRASAGCAVRAATTPAPRRHRRHRSRERSPTSSRSEPPGPASNLAIYDCAVPKLSVAPSALGTCQSRISFPNYLQFTVVSPADLPVGRTEPYMASIRSGVMLNCHPKAAVPGRIRVLS
jgi:hypothetical protein